MDPYDILGLNYPSTRDEIKAKYHELARKHHPDKLQHLPKEEIDANEQEFKKINLAYELLTKKEFQYTTKKEWKGIWDNMNMSDIFTDPDLLRDMNDILQNVINGMKSYANKLITEHHITLELSLEDVYHKKEKKLRLFLKGFIEPIFININCKEYPFFIHKYNMNNGSIVDIHITFKLLPHNTYSLDYLFETKDIFYNLDINLYEYLYGCSKKIEYLDKTILNIIVKPCNIESIEIPNKGLYDKGKLIVFIKVILPEKEEMDNFNEKKKCKLKKYLKSLSDAHHSGILDEKTI
jgi:DnaJ-class molecular chaperone